MSISFIKIDFTTKGTQLFEINAYHLQIMPININVDCTNITKTDLKKTRYAIRKIFCVNFL